MDVKKYFDANSSIPANVTINGTTIKMGQFLELMMSATLQIWKGTNNPIPLKSFSDPNLPIDSIRTGNMLKSEYLWIANDLKVYMDTTGRTPDYAYGTTLGVFLGFQNLIKLYSKVLNFYSTAKYLPDFVELESAGISAYWMWSTDAYNFNPWGLKNVGITDIFIVTRSIYGNLYLNELQHVINVCKKALGNPCARMDRLFQGK